MLPYDDPVPVGSGPEIPDLEEPTETIGGHTGTLDDPVPVDDLEVTVTQDNPADGTETDSPPTDAGLTTEEIVAGLLVAAVVFAVVWAIRNWTEGGQ